MEKRNLKPTLPRSFPMSGGDGAHSYARNSSIQRAGITNTKDKTREAISTKLDLHNHHFYCNIFRIADFGCSVGPNTFDVIDHIINSVKLKYHKDNSVNKPVEDFQFHVFFNDQSNNDFNTLFRTLPSDKKYFVAGVPGSFYGQLLPRNSLHIGHTSYTLHWLSRAPEIVGHQNSGAHKEQFKKDMEAFLQARAEELVPGGLMIILGLCISDGFLFAETAKCMLFDIFLGCLIEIAKSGGISKEKAESFNLPLYYPHFAEVKELLEQNRSFTIEMMEEVKHPYKDMSISYEYIVSFFRGLFYEVLEENFGNHLVDKLFDRFAEKLPEFPLHDFHNASIDTEYVVVLKRNLI